MIKYFKKLNVPIKKIHLKWWNIVVFYQNDYVYLIGSVTSVLEKWFKNGKF